MKNFIWKIASLLAVVAFLNACTPDQITQDLSADSPEDLAAVENVLQDADDMAAFKMAPGSTEDTNTTCPTATWANEQGTFPNTLTLDFGDGCVCGRTQRVKAGKLIITQTDDFTKEGAVRTITPENFTVDGATLEGVRTVTHLGFTESGMPSYGVEVTAKLTFASGKSVSWEASRVRTWIEGYLTEEVEDDVFSITGGSTGTNQCGTEFTSTITEPLIASRSCQWITQGVRTLTTERGTRTLDFGDGTCDNDAVITLKNGETKNIKLRR
ncbi:MAG: hypothetical protein H6581_19570 [Bacteroidia bacterium]|nr:hypothetical protein [Bacteroidia bacterium]